MAQNCFSCSLCCFVSNYYVDFQQHFVRKHKHDPNFSVSCSIDSCGFQTRNWSTFRSHVHRIHRHVKLSESDSDLQHTEDTGYTASSSPVETGQRCIDLQYQNAVFTLALEVQHNVSQRGIDKIVDTTAALVTQHVQAYADKVRQKLLENGISPSVVDDVDIDTYLENFQSAPKRLKYYADNLPYVSPVEVKLGSEKKLKNGFLVDVEMYGYVIPFLDSLKVLLNMPEVWMMVCSGHASRDEFMHDIVDGSYVRNHELFSNNHRALQVLLYTDDFEIANPLGSHVKKHKVTVFYYSIANIAPSSRSQLQTMQLLAIAKTAHARKPGFLNKLLANFVSDICALSSSGVRMLIHGEYHIIQGSLVCVLADTLAAHWLGGVKEGVAFAQKGCRNCECMGRDMRSVFTSSSCTLRNNEIHKQRCIMLDSDLTVNTRRYWSKVWGINGASPLQILDFPITTGFVQDPMHVLLEGVVPHELALLLYKIIYVQKLCTESFLNCAIEGFNYSYLHTNSKPERIDKSTVAECVNIKQTASAMLTLCHVLPLILGPKVPENNVYWLNWLRLLRIVLLCTSPYCSQETAATLRIIVSHYLQEFQLLYPRAPFIPKMHYLIHLPDQLLQYGPLRHHWCMRFEAKNGFFKGKKWQQFKNIPLSLARYHQAHMAYRQAGCAGELSQNYLYSGDIVHEGELVHIADRFSPQLVSQLSSAAGHELFTAYLTTSVSIHGLEYRVGCALVVNYDFNDTPVFVIVRHIVVENNNKYFILEETESE